MLTHTIRPDAKLGYVQVTDARTGQHELTFVGELAAQLESVREIRPMPEAPSQKWCSVIAA